MCRLRLDLLGSCLGAKGWLSLLLTIVARGSCSTLWSTRRKKPPCGLAIDSAKRTLFFFTKEILYSTVGFPFDIHQTLCFFKSWIGSVQLNTRGVVFDNTMVCIERTSVFFIKTALHQEPLFLTSYKRRVIYHTWKRGGSRTLKDSLKISLNAFGRFEVNINWVWIDSAFMKSTNYFLL